MSKRQNEHVLLVLFEGDHVREPVDGCFADHRAFRPRARPCRVGFWGVADSIEGSRNLRDELVAQSWTSLFVPEAALRSSACASGCSSRRTSLFEFLQDLGARGVPAGRLNATFSDVSRTPFQFGRPCRGDFLVRLFQTGKQFLRDPSAVDACQAQSLGKQLVRRHGVILAPALENRPAPSGSVDFGRSLVVTLDGDPVVVMASAPFVQLFLRGAPAW